MQGVSNIQAVAQARRQFFAEGQVPAGLIPAHILRSWSRCGALGLDSHTAPVVEPLSTAALRELCQRRELFHRHCRPELDALLGAARRSGSIMLLTDADGLILDSRGDDGFGERAASVALRPGALWGEGATGTNAVGTALVERRPVVVYGAEHYFERHGMLRCAASPILDPFGAILGVLDLSGHAASPYDQAAGLVAAAVSRIEHRFFAAPGDFADCEMLRFHSDAGMLDTPEEGILVFRGDRLHAANRQGLALTGLDWQALGQSRRDEIFDTQRSRFGDRLRLSKGGDSLVMRRSASTARPMTPVSPPAATAPKPFEPWLAPDQALALSRMVRLVDARIPVLLHGATGTGKEVFARQIHRGSARGAKPFIAVNCAALPESLIESELFGYEEGAFTGARRHGFKGLLREAHGGTLFLDEIGDMPLGLQPRLLRVLQEREVTPLGAARAVPIDFNLICATHRDLDQAMSAGTFRSDLYYRIAQYTHRLPDLCALPDRFALIAEIWRDLAGVDGPVLAPETLALLVAYDWPGNFRQLTGTLKTLAVLAGAEAVVTPDLLPPTILGPVARPPLPAVAGGGLEDITLAAMQSAVTSHGGNISRAARALGIHRSTLHRHLRGGRA